MKRHTFSAIGILVILIAGCGENLAPTTGGSPDDPRDLKALAVDSTTVRLVWSLPTSATDSLFNGYILEYLGRAEEIGKTSLSYTATGLPAGLVAFRLLSRFTNGRESPGVSISWAAAYRFDQGVTLREYLGVDLTRGCGLEAGSATSNPRVLSFTSPDAPTTMDLYLWGGGVDPDLQGSPLELRSASIYQGLYRVTISSSVEHTAPSLDYPLAVFPAIETFDRLAFPVQDNTIYYVRVMGDAATYNFVRLHVRVVAGDVAPNRRVTVAVSLQKAPYLQIAEAGSPVHGRYAMALPLAGR